MTRGLPYVEAAKVQGAGSGRILWKLILPSVISPLTVQASFIFAQAIISEASLSFLGAGIPAPLQAGATFCRAVAGASESAMDRSVSGAGSSALRTQPESVG